MAIWRKVEGFAASTRPLRSVRPVGGATLEFGIVAGGLRGLASDDLLGGSRAVSLLPQNEGPRLARLRRLRSPILRSL